MKTSKSSKSSPIAYEVIPGFDVVDMSTFKVVREIVDVPAEEVEEQVLRVAENSRTFEPKTGKAADGDQVTIDYLGKIDGVPFEGGADQDAELVIGPNRFIPGFEEQLTGLKAGDEKVITVTFPAEYQAAHLAGKEATFDITVKSVAAPGELVVNDDLAKTLGLDSADKLREIIRSQIESQYGQVTRQKLKRQILDQLDEVYKFEAPSKLVDAEFDKDTREGEITVRFVGELTSVIRDKAGEIIEGNPNEIKRQKDVWTFARIMGSKDPNWLLVATGG